MNPQLRRLALDLGPLIIFLVLLGPLGTYKAVGVFMALVLIALAIGYGFERKLSPMPLFTAIVVTITGGLTLYFRNDTFFRMKPTLIYGCFGFLLLGGLAFNRLFIKYVLDMAFELDDAGWRKLTLRWGLFFLFLMVLNEIIWRHVSFKVWGYSKIGLIGLTILFALAQTPLLMKHQRTTGENPGSGAQD